MLVTFRCNSRVLNYRPGVIYTAELTPLLKAILGQDRQLSLIDPPTFDKPARRKATKPASIAPVVIEPVITEPVTIEPVQKPEEENIDHGHQESIQDS